MISLFSAFRGRFQRVVLLLYWPLFSVNNGYAQTFSTPTPVVSVSVVIDPPKTFQTIEHFGASDAWSCQFVGQWPDAQKNAIADLLFSRDTLAGGQPKGIGLSIWRFNVGAGTAEQGNESGIKDEWRRAESFLNPDGSYNWDKQAGQRWFLQAAKQRGVPYFLAFANSPPVQYTLNGKGYASNKVPNLGADRYDSFARFLADVVKGVSHKTGVVFTYVSPVNEPQWDWSDGGQEGTPFHNNQIAGITRALSNALLTGRLTTTISIAEAGQIEFLYSDNGRRGQGTQISGFYDKQSPDYLGNLTNLAPNIGYHSYFTTSPYGDAVKKRRQVAASLAALSGQSPWMTEYCILGDNGGEINGAGRNLGIDPAVYVAKVIHNDLVNAGASAWHWWLALSPYDYKDGLVYVAKEKTGGRFQPSKMLWSVGNFSRFIQSGAVRVAVDTETNTAGLLVSAYRNPDGQLVTVVINPSVADQSIRVAVSAGQLNHVSQYTTSATTNLGKTAIPRPSDALMIPAKSVVTLVGDVKK